MFYMTHNCDVKEFIAALMINYRFYDSTRLVKNSLIFENFNNLNINIKRFNID